MNIQIKKVFIIVLAVFTSISFTTCKKVTIPAQPTDVKAWQENVSIIISWKSVNNATTYKIYRSASDNYIPIGTVSKSGGEEEKFVDKSPLNGMNYYKVTAFNEDVESLGGGYATCNYIFYLPKLTTLQPTNLTFISATLGGNISDIGNPPYTERGVCWSTSEYPTTDNNQQQIYVSGTGEFIINVTDLAENTVYYVCAYAINTKGTVYGNQVSFTTKKIKGVAINGVDWATRNVDMPGTFAKNPQDAGMFYQWSRKIGWSGTDPLVNSNGGTNWNNSIPSGSAWEKVNDPSPTGWRVPTKKEIESLLNKTYVTSRWATENEVRGTRFSDKATGNSIFLPAPGYRHFADGGLDFINNHGDYWSSARSDAGYAYCLCFGNSQENRLFNDNMRYGNSIRPVAE